MLGLDKIKCGGEIEMVVSGGGGEGEGEGEGGSSIVQLGNDPLLTSVMNWN